MPLRVLALRDHAIGAWPPEVREVSDEAELQELLQDDAEVELVIIAEDVPDPVRAAQRIHSRDDTLEVMILCGSDGCAQLERVLAFSPFVGRQVRCHPSSAPSVLRFECEAGSRRTRDRRQHRAWIAAAQRSLALGAPRATSPYVLDRLLDDAPLGILLLDRGGKVLACNHWTEKTLGLTEAGVLGRPLDAVLRTAGGSAPVALGEGVAAGFASMTEPETVELCHADGSTRWMRVTASQVGTQGSEPTTMLILQDVTAQREQDEQKRELEERVLHAQKLESLGILAGGVAHDFNNLLSGILGNAYLVRDQLAPDGPLRLGLDEIVHAAKTAANLTSQLLAYAGKGRFSTQVVDLNALIGDLKTLLETSVRGKARLRLDLDDALSGVEADATQIQQVLMNLVLNAAQAGDGRQMGDILLGTKVVQLGDLEIRRLVPGSPARPGRYVALDVEDTGRGMDDATRARMFDPFFTTKRTGRGLGLAATLGIVHAHDGGIMLDSFPGKGTRMTVFLPVSDRPLTPSRESVSGDLHGQGLILVVDDEEYLLRALGFGLEHFGYRVILADSGRKALDFFQRRGQQIDLVVLDMTMPGLSGAETFRALREIRPDARILLMSGFTEEHVAHDLGSEEVVEFIKKPFDPEGLAKRVKQMLGADGGVESRAPARERPRRVVPESEQLESRLDTLEFAVSVARDEPDDTASLQTAWRLAHDLQKQASRCPGEISRAIDRVAGTLSDMLNAPARLAGEWEALAAALAQAHTVIRRPQLPDVPT